MYSSLLPQLTTCVIGFFLNAANDVRRFFTTSEQKIENNTFPLDARAPREQGYLGMLKPH